MTITPATHAISINPATGEQLSVLPWAGANDIENALQLAAAGFRDWRETNIDYRAEKLRSIAVSVTEKHIRYRTMHTGWNVISNSGASIVTVLSVPRNW